MTVSARTTDPTHRPAPDTAPPSAGRPLRFVPGLQDVPVADEHVVVHGHRVRYLRAGTAGPVVLLVHGLAGDAETWLPVIPLLARHCRVIAPDLLGHGMSAKPRGDYSTAAFAAGARDLLMVLGLDRATVVGHSLGGGIAMQFAYLFPEHTERLALISSGGLGRRVSPLLRAATLPGASLVIPLVANRWTAPLVEGAVDRAARLGLPVPVLIREAAAGFVRMGETPAVRAFTTTVGTSVDLWGQRTTARDRLYLARLLPTLFVTGDRDGVIPAEHSIRAAAESGGRLEVVEGAGHVPFWDRPEQVAGALLDFVQTTTAASTTPEQVRHAMRERSGTHPQR